ncbi:MAG: late competence development ComFB family protein [Desulfotomaculum sp.]|jgi:competence protein ComFB|nr:late competence development ComFB family protein [Desulfotomaculum sp.]MCL0033044.1 late competence development ComFB family protein [Peptococcaceae bacterium]
MVYNYTELMVRQYLDSILKEYKKNNPNMCTCELCKQDIIAIALNNLSTRYVTTEKGRIINQVLLEQIDQKAEIITQILKAIQIVKKNPRHQK